MLNRIDLKRDFRKHKAEYMAAIEKVCEETAFSGGKYADQFAKEFGEYCGVKFCTGVSNGTTALQAAMMALGVGPGDEVIVPANTYIATAWGVTHAGGRPFLWIVRRIPGKLMLTGLRRELHQRQRALSGFTCTASPWMWMP